MTERTTVRLPGELLTRARRKAAAEGRTLTSLIEDGLRLVVSEKPRKRKANRGPLPVSKAKGGPLPGIAIADTSALEEMDDLEYVRRMSRLR